MSKKDKELVVELRKYADHVRSIGCWQAAAVMRKAGNRLAQIERESATGSAVRNEAN